MGGGDLPAVRHIRRIRRGGVALLRSTSSISGTRPSSLRRRTAWSARVKVRNSSPLPNAAFASRLVGRTCWARGTNLGDPFGIRVRLRTTHPCRSLATKETVMARTIHAEVAYSFKRLDLVLIAAAPSGDTAVLQRIEQLLVDAGDAYRQRRYLDAIDAYTEARRLIWSQLYPTSRFDEIKIRKLDVFKTVLSYAGEWLNALPAGTGAVGVRPREVVEIDTGPVTGLRLDALTSSGVKAAGDVSAAAVLERSGNAAAAKFFRNRATEQAPDLFNAGNVLMRRPLAEEGLLPRVSFRNDRDRVVLKQVDVPEEVARSNRKFVTMVEVRPKPFRGRPVTHRPSTTSRPRSSSAASSSRCCPTS